MTAWQEKMRSVIYQDFDEEAGLQTFQELS